MKNQRIRFVVELHVPMYICMAVCTFVLVVGVREYLYLLLQYMYIILFVILWYIQYFVSVEVYVVCLYDYMYTVC